MCSAALALVSNPVPAPAAGRFTLPGLQIFDRVPEHCGVAALQGAVVVYDPDILHREEVQEGAFYVRESQRPAALMQWETWLRLEVQEQFCSPGSQPRSPLRTAREVIQLVRRPVGEPDRWWHRLASGFLDGPYYDWAFALNLVGKVVGIYLPH